MKAFYNYKESHMYSLFLYNIHLFRNFNRSYSGSGKFGGKATHKNTYF